MRKYNITVNGKTYEVEVEEVGGSLMGRGHIRPASVPAAAASAAAPEAARPAPAQTAQTQTAAASTPAQAAAAPKAASAGGKDITSGITGKVFKITTSAGQAVKAGDTVLILEAMKMEIPIVSPEDGTIAEIKVAVGDAVETGQVLATLS